MPKKINKETAEEKAKPSKESLEKAKRELEDTKKDLELLEEEYKLRKEFRDLMYAQPQPVNPTFAFEKTDKFVELKRRDIDLGWKKWIHRQYNPQKEFLENKIKEIKQFLERWEGKV